MNRFASLKTKVHAAAFVVSFAATVVALGAPFKWGCLFL
jgi:hypothetical protein